MISRVSTKVLRIDDLVRQRIMAPALVITGEKSKMYSVEKASLPETDSKFPSRRYPERRVSHSGRKRRRMRYPHASVSAGTIQELTLGRIRLLCRRS